MPAAWCYGFPASHPEKSFIYSFVKFGGLVLFFTVLLHFLHLLMVAFMVCHSTNSVMHWLTPYKLLNIFEDHGFRSQMKPRCEENPTVTVYLYFVLIRITSLMTGVWHFLSTRIGMIHSENNNVPNNKMMHIFMQLSILLIKCII